MNPGILPPPTQFATMPRGLLGRPTPVPVPDQYWHPDALGWRNRVLRNGGSVSSLATMRAVSQFCWDIESAGLRNRFYRLNLFCGDQLAAALVPLFLAESATAVTRGSTTDTNIGPFVSGDFANTGATAGLKGDGATKSLNTGLNANTITASRAVFGVGVLATDTRVSALFAAAMGLYDTGTSLAYDVELRRTNSDRNCLLGIFNPTSAYGEPVLSAPAAAGNLVCTFPNYYRNAIPTGTIGTAATTYTAAHPIYVFGVNNGASAVTVSRTDARLGWYMIGVDMSQVDVLSFNAAINNFNAALSRR